MRAGSVPISRRSRKTDLCFVLHSLLLGTYLLFNTFINGKLSDRKNQVKVKFDHLHLELMFNEIRFILKLLTISKLTTQLKCTPKTAKERFEKHNIQVRNGTYLNNQQKRELNYINKEIVEIHHQFISEMRKANLPEHHVQDWTKHYQSETKRMDLSSNM